MHDLRAVRSFSITQQSTFSRRSSAVMASEDMSTTAPTIRVTLTQTPELLLRPPPATARLIQHARFSRAVRDAGRDSTAEESPPPGRPRPDRVPALRARRRSAPPWPTSTVLLARSARCAGFRRWIVVGAATPRERRGWWLLATTAPATATRWSVRSPTPTAIRRPALRASAKARAPATGTPPPSTVSA